MRPSNVRLRPSFDPELLAREVDALAHLTRVKPGPYATAGWDGIALVQGEGRLDDTRSPMPSRTGPRPTPALATCPGLAELIATMPGPVLVARLLYLEPGGSAGLHRDPIGLAVGVVRLHVPIITHPDVELWLGGERTRWGAGELWYGDFAFPHRLANPSPVTRVHLVLDVCVTDALLALFPSELVASVTAGGAYTFVPRVELADADLSKLARRLKLPRASLPGVLTHEDLDAAVEDGAIVMRAGEELALVLDPIDATTLSIRGYYPGVTFECLPDGGVDLVHRGRVRIPDGMDGDDERAPWELHTSRCEVAAP